MHVYTDIAESPYTKAAHARCGGIVGATWSSIEHTVQPGMQISAYVRRASG